MAGVAQCGGLTSRIAAWSVRYDGWVDDALQRLERVLADYPFDRALPDLDLVLREADVSADLLSDDDRARKLIHEALVARPHHDLDAVRAVRTEVELMVLEVRSLERIFGDPSASLEAVDAASDRLAVLARRLRDLQAQL